MKRLLCACGLASMVTLVLAQTPIEMERQAQSQRLQERREQLEASYLQDLRACYQQFDVTSCRLQAREKRIRANAALRQDEIAFNKAERLLKAEEAQRRLMDKQSDGERQEATVQREEAQQNARNRLERQTLKLAEHDTKGQGQKAYEQKQREAREHRAELEKKLRERNKPPAAPLPVPGVSP